MHVTIHHGTNSHDCSSLRNQQHAHRLMGLVTFNTKIKGEIAFWAKTCTHRRKPRPNQRVVGVEGRGGPF